MQRAHVSSPQGPRLLWPVKVWIVMAFTSAPCVNYLSMTYLPLSHHHPGVTILLQRDLTSALKAYCAAQRKIQCSFFNALSIREFSICTTVFEKGIKIWAVCDTWSLGVHSMNVPIPSFKSPHRLFRDIWNLGKHFKSSVDICTMGRKISM